MSFAGASGITYSLWSARPCPSARFGQPHGENRLSDSPVISIIDDDESVLVAVKRFVRSLGFIGHTFGSAGEFLHSPDLAETSCVITDIEMPGMSGVTMSSNVFGVDQAQAAAGSLRSVALPLCRSRRLRR